MQFEITNDPDRYWSVFDHFRNRSIGKYFFTALLIGAALVFLLDNFYTQLLQAAHEAGHTNLEYTYFIFLGVAAIIMFGCYRIAKKMGTRKFTAGLTEVTLGPITYQITEQGVQYSGADHHAFYSWSLFKGVERFQEFMVLYIDDLVVLPIPVDQVPDLTEFDQFVRHQLINNKSTSQAN